MPSTNGHGPKPERIALYLRVSSEEQVERESIGTQEEFLADYCKLYGLDVAGIYKDEAVSGTVPLLERPGGRRLIEDAKAGKFASAIVYKLDRVGRTLLVVVDAHDRLMEAGVALRSATEPIDTSTPAGRLIFQMLASFAEFERSTIAERSRHGLHRAFKGGAQPGRIPFGYDLDEDGQFIVVEEEAAVVRAIITNVGAGSTLYSEAQRLNAEGVPSPGRKYRGKAREPGGKWTHTTVRKICARTAYNGTHTISTSKGPIEREVPAIIKPGVQQRALETLAENKRYHSRPTDRKYLLRGLIRCGVCGLHYVGHPAHCRGEKRYYYTCSRKHREHYAKSGERCSSPYVQAGWIEDLVWQDVREFLQNPGEVLHRIRQQLEVDGATDDLEERHASLTKRLTQKQAEKKKYARLYAQELIDEGESETLLLDIKNQIENLRLLISSVEADIALKQEDQAVAKSAAAWLMALRKNLAEVEQDTDEAFKKRHDLAKLLVEGITVGRTEVGRTKVDITYRFGEPPGAEGKRDYDVDIGTNSQMLVETIRRITACGASLVIPIALATSSGTSSLGYSMFSTATSPGPL
jgi:site-specific DNA recombinase